MTKLIFKYNITPGFISVIIPVYKEYIGLRDTLASLCKQTLSNQKYEIIVANDGGDKNITSVCQEFNVQSINIIPRRGAYFARNRALEESSGEFIALLDAEIVVPKCWLENGCKLMRKADYVGGPVHIDHSKITTPADYFEYCSAFPFKYLMEAQHFSGAGNLFVKRVVFQEVGGFDERLYSGGDNEFGKRVYYRSNYKQLYSETIPTIHPPRGFKNLVKQTVKYTQGTKLLSSMYPDLYTYEKPRIIYLFFKSIIPPRIKNIRGRYKEGLPFSFFQYYLFCWQYKIAVNYNQVIVYYKK